MLCLICLCLSGCILRTTDEMYRLPKRSAEYNDLQKAIDGVMEGLSYSAPVFGENQQLIQMSDLDGDGEEEVLLFAKSSGENPLKIFILGKVDGSYQKIAAIESVGSGYEQAEYAQVDGKGGMELIVGRQVGEGVPYSLSVYSFPASGPELLLTTNYARFLTYDLDRDQKQELFVLSQDPEAGTGIAALYYFGSEDIERSTEAVMSVPADQVRRIAAGNMCSNTPAVFVASVYDENTIITDVYAYLNGKLTNVSLSNESGTSMETIRNYYVYADDIDGDGLIELPALLPMRTVEGQPENENQNLIQWYNLTRTGGERVKLTTYHNYSDGWYVVLPENWVDRISVLPGGDGETGKSYVFCGWNDSGKMEKILTIYACSGDDREERAIENGRFVVGRKAEVVYCVSLGSGPMAKELTQADVIEHFHLIQIAWKTGET